MVQNLKILTNLWIIFKTITCAKYAQMTRSEYIMTCIIIINYKHFSNKNNFFLNLTMLAFHNNNLKMLSEHLILVFTRTF